MNNTCSIEGCIGLGKKSKTGSRNFLKGFCISHYNMFKKYGDPLFRKRNKKIPNRKSHSCYITYHSMLQRCYDTNKDNYKWYGGKGITVCDSWRGVGGFDNFVEDMGEREEGMTLDRINPNLPYNKENCRWANKHTQMANQTSNNPIVGISFYKSKNAYVAELMINKVKVFRKSFKNYEDAVTARKEAELKYNIYETRKNS